MTIPKTQDEVLLDLRMGEPRFFQRLFHVRFCPSSQVSRSRWDSDSTNTRQCSVGGRTAGTNQASWHREYVKLESNH